MKTIAMTGWIDREPQIDKESDGLGLLIFMAVLAIAVVAGIWLNRRK